MIFLEFIQTLTEGTRTPHPEDSIFLGKAAALSAIDDMMSAVVNPKTVSIKWDGSPAIIFGRRVDGKFTMNYKEYINMPGGQVTTSDELLHFYTSHGKNLEVGQKLASIFNAVASIVPPGFKGFIQGDVMWTEPLKLDDGKFVFHPNPYGVYYKVGKSAIPYKEIQGRSVGIAVHTYGSDIVAGKEPLAGKHSLDGLGGLSPSNKFITILTGNMGTQFKIKTPVTLETKARTMVNTYGDSIDAFINSISASARAVLQTYYNRKYTKQPMDTSWLPTKLGNKQYAIFTAAENQPAIDGIDKIYGAIYNLKLGLLSQLEPQVKGVEQYVNTAPVGAKPILVPKGEGFNIDSPNGFLKLVDRGVFSAANFAGRA